jgi:hypothetical protein
MPRDSFAAAAAQTPDAIGPLELTIRVHRDAEGQRTYEARYSFDVYSGSGIVEVRQGELIPHLTSAEVASLRAVVDNAHGKAEGTVS